MLLRAFVEDISESRIAAKMIPWGVIFQPKWLKSEN